MEKTKLIMVDVVKTNTIAVIISTIFLPKNHDSSHIDEYYLTAVVGGGLNNVGQECLTLEGAKKQHIKMVDKVTRYESYLGNIDNLKEGN